MTERSDIWRILLLKKRGRLDRRDDPPGTLLGAVLVVGVLVAAFVLALGVAVAKNNTAGRDAARGLSHYDFLFEKCGLSLPADPRSDLLARAIENGWDNTVSTFRRQIDEKAEKYGTSVMCDALRKAYKLDGKR